MYQYIRTEFSDGVGRLTLNRPEKRNALKRDFIEEIKQGIHELSQDEALRVFVLQAEGSVFCAGMDLGEMQERAQSADGKAEWQRDSEVYCDVLVDLYSLKVPTIAAVSGPALAGGMGMILACDLMIASDNTFFMLPEPMRGITAAMVTPFLVHRMGAGPATYLLLSGKRLTAEKAGQLSLCHEVVAAEEFTGQLDSLIQSVLTGSKSALEITKNHIAECLSVDLIAQVKKSILVSAEARETEDAREGLAAFLEKRQPHWQPAS